MHRLEGKVVLVTGGARGQGRAHALRLAEEGADIVVTDIAAQIDSVPYPMASETDLVETAKLVEALDRRCVAVQADARDAGQMAAAVRQGRDELGRLDAVIVNHGIGTPGGWDAPDEVIDDIVAVNLRSVLTACRATIPVLIEQGRGGSIVLTSSAAGLRPYAGLTIYTMAKHGVIGLMRALSADLAPHGIRVNALCPGAVDTPMLMNDTILSMFCGVPTGGTREGAAFAARNLGLLPEPFLSAADIAAAGAWLVSDDARYVTGTALSVDLGTVNQPPGIPPVAAEALAAQAAPAG
jgi:SDR family mycofactocin-dependent oxidoreductase